MTRFNPVTPQVLEALKNIVGTDNISTAQAEIDLHAQDAGFHPAHPAEVVVWGITAQHL